LLVGFGALAVAQDGTALPLATKPETLRLGQLCG
jgi:hypothetical protein